MRLSPQLHVWLYGFHQHSFLQNERWGGYRPMVFMEHGLMVAMWMCMTALVGLWLWRAETLSKIFDLPIYVLASLLFVTAILCRSTYAIALLMSGIGLLWCVRWFGAKWIIAGMLVVPPVFIGLRATGVLDGET